MLPQAFGANSSASALLALWAAKGFNGRELAALLGAHSVSQAFAQQQNGIPTGGMYVLVREERHQLTDSLGPQDTTPRAWDTNYFKQTHNGTSAQVFSFDSDKNLAKLGTASGAAFKEFGNDFNAWSTAFKAAMYKLTVLGISQSKVAGFIDCTSAVS